MANGGVSACDSVQLSPTHRYPSSTTPKILYPPSGLPRQINSVHGEDKSHFLKSVLWQVGRDEPGRCLESK